MGCEKTTDVGDIHEEIAAAASRNVHALLECGQLDDGKLHAACVGIVIPP